MGLFGVFGGKQGRRIDESLLLDRAVFARVDRAAPVAADVPERPPEQGKEKA